ncbi:MAG TPA: proton-conducting transporter membrane subunit [Candidatus Limnocylindrales bacterium]
MSILAFLAACAFGAVFGLMARPSRPASRLVPLAALLAAFAAALFIGAGTSQSLGDVTLAGSKYSGLFLACMAGSALLLCIVALASGWHDEFAPAALATLAGTAVAVTSTDAGVALIAGAAGATAGALLITGAAPRAGAVDGRAFEMRAIAAVSGAMLLGGIAILRPAWTGDSDSPILILAFVGFALAIAIRGGVVPFHVPAIHLRRSAIPMAPALMLVWIPAGLGLLAVAWSATTFPIQSDTLRTAAACIEAVGVATLLLGALAALVHDDLDEVVIYSIVADAGFILLAFAARTDLAAEPARLWILVFIAAKTALVAWAAAVSRAYGTSEIGTLRGWLRRTPLLGLALVIIAIATIGWPGSNVYEARSALIRMALPSQLQFVFLASIAVSAAYYVRLLVFGVLPPSDEIRAGQSERPRLAPAIAMAEVAPSVAAEVVEAAEAVPPVVVSAAPAPETTAATASSDAAEAVAAEAVAAEAPGPTSVPHPRSLPAMLRLNKGLGASLLIVGGAILAAALASGSLGAGTATRYGIPLDTAAHATAAPVRTPTPVPPTPTPRTTLAPAASNGPVGSDIPTIAPSGSQAPMKTSAPARDNTD